MLKEVALVSSVASPDMLEALIEDGSRLKEALSRTGDMIQLKREERDKGLLKVVQGRCGLDVSCYKVKEKLLLQLFIQHV